MGQSVSKGISKTVERVTRKATDAAQPPGPPQVPKRPSPGTVGGVPATKANNPASFLRGTGIAAEDIRDKGQEMFLQTLHKVDDEAKAKGPVDMPEDLLKFIQDVGPTRQSVDKEFTAPRLLEKENESELNKVESARSVTRDRIKMPLMGEDNNFTTTKNTNFSKLSTQEDPAKEFGLSNLQLFRLISTKQDVDLDAFYTSVVSNEDAVHWTDDEIAGHQELLQQAMNAIEVPVLRRDSEGTFYGLYPKNVPGPEVKSVHSIPKNKMKLVLEDLSDRDERSDDIATARLERRRELRKNAPSS